MTDQQLNDIRLKIAGVIKKRRIELGYSQEKLAQLTGLSIRTISRSENADFWLVMKQWVIICNVLKIDFLNG